MEEALFWLRWLLPQCSSSSAAVAWPAVRGKEVVSCNIFSLSKVKFHKIYDKPVEKFMWRRTCFILTQVRHGIQNISYFDVYSQPDLDTKFIQLFGPILHIPVTSFCWIDLQVALKWIVNLDLHPQRLVKCRVDKIYLMTSTSDWSSVHTF